MLSDKELEHLAGLARIKLDKKEKKSLKKDLGSILDYVKKLDAVDVSDTEPLYQTTGLANSTREDGPRNEFTMNEDLNEKLIGQAPHRQDRFIKVRPVLKR